MTLISKHATGETSSPFYQENKRICEDYQKYIEDLGGSVKGHYNAFSYTVVGYFNARYKWNLKIKKATYSSSGNLILSSKKQSLLELSQWSSKHFSPNCPNFKIRRMTFWDHITNPLFGRWKGLDGFKGYVIKTKDSENETILKINEILENLYNKKIVFTVSFNNPEILIDLRTNEVHKEEIKKLLNL